MTRNAKEWVIAFGLMTILVTAHTVYETHSLSSIPYVIPHIVIGGTFGAYVGLGHAIALHDITFILKMLLALIMLCIGVFLHKNIYGKMMIFSGIYFWSMAGASILIA